MDRAPSSSALVQLLFLVKRFRVLPDHALTVDRSFSFSVCLRRSGTVTSAAMRTLLLGPARRIDEDAGRIDPVSTFITEDMHVSFRTGRLMVDFLTMRYYKTMRDESCSETPAKKTR